MFRENLATYPYIHPVNSYTDNLGKATKAFLAALVAITPDETETVDAAQDRVIGIEELNNLAAHFDTFMPNQAAELRYLAGSDDTPDTH